MVDRTNPLPLNHESFVKAPVHQTGTRICFVRLHSSHCMEALPLHEIIGNPLTSAVCLRLVGHCRQHLKALLKVLVMGASCVTGPASRKQGTVCLDCRAARPRTTWE